MKVMIGDWVRRIRKNGQALTKFHKVESTTKFGYFTKCGRYMPITLLDNHWQHAEWEVSQEEPWTRLPGDQPTVCRGCRGLGKLPEA